MQPFVIEQPMVFTSDWMGGRDPCERARFFVEGLSPADWTPENPLAAIGENDVPEFHRINGTCGAIAIQEPTAGLVEAIQRRGIPYNNGPAIVLGSPICESDARAIPVMIHEAAHGIEQYRSEPPSPRPDGKLAFAELQLAIDQHLGDAYAARPWIGHGPQWIRIVIHLWFRAQLAGVPVLLDSCAVAGEYYGLSDPLNYLNALESTGELSRWLRWQRPLKALVTEPYPPEYAELWQRDARRPAQDCR